MLKLFRALKSADAVICQDQLLNYGYGKNQTFKCLKWKNDVYVTLVG